MEVPTGTVVALLLVGLIAMTLATSVSLREAPAARGRRARGLAPLVPWIGSVLVVVLLVRGAVAGAVVVGVATLLHAGIARLRAFRADRDSRVARD
jgi:hypothetical protein